MRTRRPTQRAPRHPRSDARRRAPPAAARAPPKNYGAAIGGRPPAAKPMPRRDPLADPFGDGLTDDRWRALYVGPLVAVTRDGRPVRSLEAVRCAEVLALNQLTRESGYCYDVRDHRGADYLHKKCGCGHRVAKRLDGGRVLAMRGCDAHAHFGRDGGECSEPGRAIDCPRCYWRCWECGAKTEVGFVPLSCRRCDTSRAALIRYRRGAGGPLAEPSVPVAVALSLPWSRFELDPDAGRGWPLARVLWLAMAGGGLRAATTVARRHPRLFGALVAFALAAHDPLHPGRSGNYNHQDCYQTYIRSMMNQSFHLLYGGYNITSQPIEAQI